MNDPKDTLIVAVDGGGSGCRAAIGTQSGGILAKATSGAANYSTDPHETIRHILAAVNGAAKLAGLPDTALGHARAHLGIAGVMGPLHSDQIADQMPFANTMVTDDRPTSVIGALNGRDGYVVSAGTGIVAAVCQRGVVKSVSGWGFHVSDQGSGAWLGRAALEQVLLCCDGLADHTDVTRQILQHHKGDPAAVSAFAVAAKPDDFATFAPIIVTGALAQDPWAQDILTLGADYLTRFLTALGFRNGDPLCLIGGLGDPYAGFIDPDTLVGRIPPHGDALDGAFQLAIQSGRSA